jgi:superfamily II DNA or RNA helicase
MVHARSFRPSRRLETDEAGLTMEARLVRGAGRIVRDAAPGDGPPALRDEQARVFADFATYLTDVATRPPAEQRPPFCRIILPPRTGKTAVAGHIIDRSSLTAAFIVPTRALLDQTMRELALWVPGVAIGSYSGERQSVVDHGVNVVTYAMLQTHAAALPPELRRSALVFVDEAHHAMTPSRSAILAHAFDPLALRVALTATPNYDSERRLVHYFPELIHEITLEEALALDLLAPLRVWVAEVDADGSRVRFVAGDFHVDDLGRLMSSAPFFRAVEVFRYDPENAHRPCLVACASRQQAHDRFQYLRRHRPRSSSPPVLVLGDTPREHRERALAAFERGRVDTIIQVGVLLEGWSSPRCKLLLDLAPSVSRVRATQKYFRVMTRHRDEEARIVVLKLLCRLPRRKRRMLIHYFGLFGAPRPAFPRWPR